MRTWFAFRLADGMLTGQRLDTASIEDRDRQTPPGCGWVGGVSHPRAQRVGSLAMDDFGDAAVPLLEDWVPPAPAPAPETAWTWDTDAREWRGEETLEGFKARLRRRAVQQLDALDQQLTRPTAEAVQAVILGEEPPAAAVARIRDLNATKAALREVMQQVAAATTAAELDDLKGALT